MKKIVFKSTIIGLAIFWQMNIFASEQQSNNISTLASTTWRLSPEAGAMAVGWDAANVGGWWSSSADDVTGRACLFDDEYVFNADGSFQNVMGDATWLEGWQGVSEGCGAPVAPHDGSNPATYAFDEASGTLTLTGLGAYIGLAKVTNQGENGVADNNTIVYNYTLSEDGHSMDLTANYPAGVWGFKLKTAESIDSDPCADVTCGDWEECSAGACVEVPHVNLTFNLDMSNATLGDGVYVGGGSLGGPGDHQMSDDDGDGVYTTTLTMATNASSHYTYLTCGDWGCKENIVGQECADPNNYNDRFLSWGEQDVTVNACFGLCGDGMCSELSAPPEVNVTFSVDMTGVNTDQGVMVSGGGFGENGPAMSDDDGDNVWEVTLSLLANTTHLYKFKNEVSGGWWGGFEDAQGLIDGGCAAGQYNDRFVDTGDSDMVLPTVSWGSCTLNEATEPEPVPDMVNLFFSEHAEGSSNNKYFEVYNPSAVDVDLANYAFVNCANGCDDWEYTTNFAAGAVLAAGGTYSVCHGSFAGDLTLCSETRTLYHNGDDVQGLMFLPDSTLLDLYGTVGADPGSGWDVAGVTNATKDHTLVRKAEITEGNTDWASSAGTNADDSEWVVFDQNTWDYLGSHPHNFAASCSDATACNNGQEGDCVYAADGFDCDGNALINLTFNLDMSNATLGEAVFVGGGSLGGPGDHQMSDSDGDGVYSATLTVPANSSSHYTYLTCGWWDCKENIAGQSCADADNYNDRFISWGSDDVTVNACFGLCGDGMCSELSVPEDVNVTFSVDMSAVDTHPEGVYIAGGGFGQDGLLMDDSDGDDVWTVTAPLMENSTHYYKFRNQPSFGTWDGFEDAQGLIDGGCAAGQYNDRFVDTGDSDMVLATVSYGSCTLDETTDPVDPTPNPELVSAVWRLSPEAGALHVGDGGGGTWWSNSADDVLARACLFDDEYVFNSDGSFQNVMGDATWLEGWQGVDEGCGAPVAPHDGTNPATWSMDPANGTLTVSGLGSFLGLAKAHNNGEDGNPVDNTTTYNYTLSDDGHSMTVSIYFGWGEWTYLLRTAESIDSDPCADVTCGDWEECSAGTCVEIPSVELTFNLDLNGASVGDGVFVGGGSLGGPGDNAMTQNEDGTYSTTLRMPTNSSSYYTYLTCAWWDCKENIAGQECSNPDNYNDRFLSWGEDDMTINACFGLCGDGLCSDLTPPADVNVTFSVDMNAVVTHPDGVYLAGGGFGQDGLLMDDSDGDDVWTVTAPLMENSTHLYKFRNQPSFGTWDGFEDAQGLIDGGCVAGPYNDRFVDTGSEDMVLATVSYGSCVLDPLPVTDLAINYSFNEDIAGFQFNLDGVEILSASGGAAGDNFDLVGVNAGMVVGVSTSGGVIPAGSGVLTVLTVEGYTLNASISELVLSNLTGSVAGGSDGFLVGTFDCAGTVGGNLVLDECGVCGGDNSSCTDCAGVLFGDSLVDECGDCQPAYCYDFVTHNVSFTGECNGPSEMYVMPNDPMNPYWNQSCTDCAGVVNGTSELDACGVCDGDGWSCAEPGDVNLDYSVNILDIVIIVDHLLGNSLINECPDAGCAGLTVSMSDAYGDGWSGNILTVGGSSFTLESGASAEDCYDGPMDVDVTCGGGSWASEVSWTLSDSDGNVVLSGGAPYTGCLGDCAPAAVCEDTDNGFADAYGDDCAAYANYPSWCGNYDTADFDSMSMCCACGGGSTGNSIPSGYSNYMTFDLSSFDSKEQAEIAYQLERQRRIDNPIQTLDSRDNDCGANALANADWNGDGFLNITDIVNIVQVILGSDLAKGTVPSYIDISYDNSSVYVESDGKVAGLQIEYNGKFDIQEKYVPSDWNINYNDNTILIFSLQGTDLIESKLFNYIGDITIESVVGVGWDGLEMTANLAVVPELYTLDPAYPNPFNPITNISYGLPVDGNVSINIYNIEGKIIETLHNGIQKAGNYSIQWDANVYPSGVYFVKFETQNFNKTQKLMLVK